MDKIRIGILGYGNLGKGVEAGVRQNDDMELVAVVTRRKPESLKINTEGVKVYHVDEIDSLKDKIDVLIMCSGSMHDLPIQGPEFARYFNTVDGFDTHADIPQYFEKMDKSSKEGGFISIIACGWDPGLFSLNRLIGNAVLPKGKDYTFWGRGVSQGHSDAIRMLDGVIDARQYTVPVEEVVNEVRQGSTKDYTTREKHRRVCYVAAKEGADLEKIENEIKTMPKYFADYDTEVNFISLEELKKNHSKLPHGGFVIRSGKTGLNEENQEIMEFKLNLDSNPEFTSSVLLAYARAAYRMNKEGLTGSKSVFDVAPSYICKESPEELRKRLL